VRPVTRRAPNRPTALPPATPSHLLYPLHPTKRSSFWQVVQNEPVGNNLCARNEHSNPCASFGLVDTQTPMEKFPGPEKVFVTGSCVAAESLSPPPPRDGGGMGGMPWPLNPSTLATTHARPTNARGDESPRGSAEGGGRGDWAEGPPIDGSRYNP